MSKQKWINLVSVYSIIYTVITLLNSVLYLCNGIYEDPSGNWHELDRAIILLIGVAAFELCTSLPIKPLILRYVVAYIPSQLLAFAYVWFTSLRGAIGKNGVSGYLDQLYGPVYRAECCQHHCWHLQEKKGAEVT